MPSVLIGLHPRKNWWQPPWHGVRKPSRVPVRPPNLRGVPEEVFAPSYVWQRGSASQFAQFVGYLNTCVLSRGVPFAQAKPKESAVLLVDNHAVVGPERWASDPSLVMLSQLYRGCDQVLNAVSGKPITRVIILKANVDVYDEKDLTVMREAIETPTTRNTYLLPAKYAGSFKGRGCAVIAQEIILEFKKSEEDSIVVKGPVGVQDATEATRVCSEVFALTQRGFSIYEDDSLNPRLASALRNKGNIELLNVLKSIV